MIALSQIRTTAALCLAHELTCVTIVSVTDLLRTRVYYMDKGILLATKTLVESICHYIRDPVAYFPYVTLASGISINSRLFSCCCFQNGRRVQASELYIYIWSKNFSHSAYLKSEAKDGGH